MSTYVVLEIEENLTAHSFYWSAPVKFADDVLSFAAANLGMLDVINEAALQAADFAENIPEPIAAMPFTVDFNVEGQPEVLAFQVILGESADGQPQAVVEWFESPHSEAILH